MKRNIPSLTNDYMFESVITSNKYILTKNSEEFPHFYKVSGGMNSA